jgi:uncharacterized membrane protein
MTGSRRFYDGPATSRIRRCDHCSAGALVRWPAQPQLRDREKVMNSSYRNIIVTAVVTAILALGSATAAPLFRAVNIGIVSGQISTWPYDLNDQGVVLAYSGGNGAADDFLWTEEHGIKLLDKVIGWAIGNQGQLAGYRPSLKRPGFIVVKSGAKPTYFLEGTWATDADEIAQINDRGEILGRSITGGSGSTSGSPWVWSPDVGLSKIVDGYPGVEYIAQHFNNVGQVVGYAFDDCSTRAFVYDRRSKKMNYLGPGDWPGPDNGCGLYNRANAVNDAGQVIGWGNSKSNLGKYRGFTWTEAEGRKILSGSDDDPHINLVQPISINSSSQIVGTYQLQQKSSRRYFYWDAQSGFIDLNDLLDPDDPLSSQIVLRTYEEYATVMKIPKINNKGQIVVKGDYKPVPSDGPLHTFLLTPVER